MWGVGPPGSWRRIQVLSPRGQSHWSLPGPFRCSRRGPRSYGSTMTWAGSTLERPTARGWGCIGRGLCVLHESPDPVEYTRPSASGSRPSCSSGGVRSDSRAEALIEPASRPGAPCTPEPACSSTPRPGVSRFCPPVSTTLRSRPPGASTSA